MPKALHMGNYHEPRQFTVVLQLHDAEQWPSIPASNKKIRTTLHQGRMADREGALVYGSKRPDRTEYLLHSTSWRFCRDALAPTRNVHAEEKETSRAERAQEKKKATAAAADRVDTSEAPSRHVLVICLHA